MVIIIINTFCVCRFNCHYHCKTAISSYLRVSHNIISCRTVHALLNVSRETDCRMRVGKTTSTAVRWGINLFSDRCNYVEKRRRHAWAIAVRWQQPTNATDIRTRVFRRRSGKNKMENFAWFCAAVVGHAGEDVGLRYWTRTRASKSSYKRSASTVTRASSSSSGLRSTAAREVNTYIILF